MYKLTLLPNLLIPQEMVGTGGAFFLFLLAGDFFCVETDGIIRTIPADFLTEGDDRLTHYISHFSHFFSLFSFCFAFLYLGTFDDGFALKIKF